MTYKIVHFPDMIPNVIAAGLSLREAKDKLKELRTNAVAGSGHYSMIKDQPTPTKNII